jgi:hypothetical protein
MARARWIGFQQSASSQVVTPVYRTRFIAVQVPEIARKGDEVPHALSLTVAAQPITFMSHTCASLCGTVLELGLLKICRTKPILKTCQISDLVCYGY